MCVALAQWHGACANFSDGARRVLHLGFCCPVSRPQYEVSSTLSDEFREAIGTDLAEMLAPQKENFWWDGLHPVYKEPEKQFVRDGTYDERAGKYV